MKEFEDAVPLGEIKSEEVTPVEQKAEENIKKDLETNQIHEVLNQTDTEILGEDKEQITEPPKSIQKQDEISENVQTSSKYSNFEKVINLSSKIISITEDENGNIFVADRYHLIGVSTSASKEILNEDIYNTKFKEPMPAISIIKETTQHGLWVGFTNGILLEYKDKNWSKKVGGPAQKKYRIEDIFELNGRIFIASKGLYEWDKTYDRFLASDDLKDTVITALEKLDDKTLLFSTESSLQEINLEDRTISKIYNSFTGDYPIKQVRLKNGDIYVGGRQGILGLTDTGYPEFRFGTNYQIDKILFFSEDSGIILTRTNELAYFSKHTVFKIDNIADITAIHLTKDNQIILGTQKGEVLKTSPEMIQKIVELNGNKNLNYFKSFPQACSATSELMKTTYFSKQISAPNIDGKRYVFIKGDQVCPNGKGFMRADGETLIINDNSELEHFKYNNRSKLNLPDQVSRENVTKLFIDSSGKIYLGTKFGLFFKESDRWARVEDSNELNNDLISDIIEDAKGNIWISTRIQSKEKLELGNDSYKALHLRLKNGSWAHFGKENGINFYGISSLEYKNKNLYLGTANGLAQVLPNSTINTFSKNQGLIKSIIEKINIDSSDKIWLAHGFFQNGISWIDDNTLYSADKESGLFANRIAITAEDDEGRIWIIDTGGETAVYSLDSLINISNQSVFNRSKPYISEFNP